MNTLSATKTSKKRLQKQAKSTLDLVKELQKKNSDGFKDEHYVPIILDIITQELDSSDLDFDDPLIIDLEEIFRETLIDYIYEYVYAGHKYQLSGCLNYIRYKYIRDDLGNVATKIKKKFNLV